MNCEDSPALSENTGCLMDPDLTHSIPLYIISICFLKPEFNIIFQSTILSSG